MRYFLRFLELRVLQEIGFYAEILLTCNLYLPQRRSLKCRLWLKVYKNVIMKLGNVHVVSPREGQDLRLTGSAAGPGKGASLATCPVKH